MAEQTRLTQTITEHGRVQAPRLALDGEQQVAVVQRADRRVVQAATPGTLAVARPAARPRARDLAVRAVFGGDSPIERLGALWGDLAAMVEGGVPLATALEQTAETARTEDRAMWLSAANRARHGAMLAEALAPYEARLPEIVLPILRTAERSGATAIALREISAAFRRSAMAHQKLDYSMANPGFMAPLLLLPSVIFMPFLIQSAPVYAAYTVLCAGVSGGVWLERHRIERWQQRTQRAAGRQIKRTPGGLTQRNLSGARWARTLATLYDCGVPISECLEVAADTARNGIHAAALRLAADRTRTGETLTASLRGVRLLPARSGDAVFEGESSGDLGSALHRFADFMEDDARMYAAQTFALRLVGPPLLAAALLAIVCFALAWKMVGWRY